MSRCPTATRRALLTAALAWPWLSAVAHGTWLPKYGGVMNDGETSFEMVIAPRQITFYLSDHGTPIATAGAQGTLTWVRDGVTRQIPLAVAGADSVKAALTERFQPGDSLLARVTLGSGSIVAGRFVMQ